MSLMKLGQIATPEIGLNTSSGISGNGFTPIGVDTSVYTPYNETCLFSSTYSCQTGTLSEPYTNFQRLRLCLGWNKAGSTDQGSVYTEYTPDSAANSCVCTVWSVGNDGNMFALCRLAFPTNTTFSGHGGKLYNWANNSVDKNWEGRLSPIREVWGINRI